MRQKVRDIHPPASPMALSTWACADRAEMRCCCSRKRATSTMELKDRFRIRSAQSQVRAQAASTSSSRGAGVTSGPISGCSGEGHAQSHSTLAPLRYQCHPQEDQTADGRSPSQKPTNSLHPPPEPWGGKRAYPTHPEARAG